MRTATFQMSRLSQLGDTLPLGFDAGAAARWAANAAAVRLTGYPMTGVYEDNGWAYYFVAPTRVIFLLKSPTKSYPGGKAVTPGSTAYTAILKVLKQGTPLPEAAAAALRAGTAVLPKETRASTPATPAAPAMQASSAQAFVPLAPLETPPVDTSGAGVPSWVPPVAVGAGVVLVLAAYFATRGGR